MKIWEMQYFILRKWFFHQARRDYSSSTSFEVIVFCDELEHQTLESLVEQDMQGWILAHLWPEHFHLLINT